MIRALRPLLGHRRCPKSLQTVIQAIQLCSILIQWLAEFTCLALDTSRPGGCSKRSKITQAPCSSRARGGARASEIGGSRLGRGEDHPLCTVVLDGFGGGWNLKRGRPSVRIRGLAARDLGWDPECHVVDQICDKSGSSRVWVGNERRNTDRRNRFRKSTRREAASEGGRHRCVMMTLAKCADDGIDVDGEIGSSEDSIHR